MFSFLSSFFKSTCSSHCGCHAGVAPQDITEIIEPLCGGIFQIEDVKIQNGQAIIALNLLSDSRDAPVIHHQIEQAVSNIKGIDKAMVVITGSGETPPFLKKEEPKLQTKMEGLPPVILAVTSGKGGVGKSTVALNLAIALSQKGKKVGILDADIYGPSLPRLVGRQDVHITTMQDGKIEPIEIFGLKTMSIGYLVEEGKATVWRGPMAQSALLQMLRDVNWSGIDVLVIDMPPGTGDIHLTLAQKVPVTGGVIVSTPQDIALVDARKGIEMFGKVGVPVLGLVENMSYYCCSECGHRDDIFGHGGARAEAVKIGVPFLGEIPLNALIRQTSDAGTPVTFSATESDEARAFQSIAQNVMDGLESRKNNEA